MSIPPRTERMVLRRLTGADADHLHELDSDPEVMRYLTGGRPTPYQVVAREILPALLAEYDHHGGLGRWAATHRDTGDFLGWFALRPPPHGPAGEAELGYRLRREAWGRGYATEGARALVRAAFTTFGLRRVYAQTMAVNRASRRVMEKAGLRLERVFHPTFDDPIPGTEHGEVEYGVERGTDERDLVRHGYNVLSYHYRRDDDADDRYSPWLATLHERLPAGARVLDLGCGCGVPVARFLADAGHRVTGIDISDTQIARARRLVPAATFALADATRLDLPAASFDAVVCLYALIHMPLAEQPRLIDRIAHWLRPGGWLLATVGQHAWTGTDRAWLGGHAAMWWSHADAASYRSWLERAGLSVTAQEFVAEGTGGHALFWARRPPRH